MEAAFFQGAGFSVDTLSIFMRTILVSLYCLWTAWSAWKQFRLVRQGALDVNEFMANTLLSLGVLSFVLVLVAV